MQRTIGPWLIEFGPDVTRRCVAHQPPGSDCDCAGCRSFDALAGRAFPPKFVGLAEALGLDVTKPSEVCHYYLRGPSGLYLTDGWFNFVGRIVGGGTAGWCNPDGSWTADAELMVPGLRFRMAAPSAPVPDVFKGWSVVQLDFLTHLPWVLPGALPG